MSGRGAIYRDRLEAGQELARRLAAYAGHQVVVLAVPNGGVAVAAPIARALSCGLHLMVVRKIQIPDNPEAGFGAVSADGATVVDEDLIDRLGLSTDQVEAQCEKALASVQKRLSSYGLRAKLPALKGKTAILVDDGLASGATMEAAVALVRNQGPARIVIAAPTSSARAFKSLQPLVDDLICPQVTRGPVFAVANAYQKWYDVSDREVLDLLAEFQENEGGKG